MSSSKIYDSMKQSKLEFVSAKRTASGNASGKAKATAKSAHSVAERTRSIGEGKDNNDDIASEEAQEDLRKVINRDKDVPDTVNTRNGLLRASSQNANAEKRIKNEPPSEVSTTTVLAQSKPDDVVKRVEPPELPELKIKDPKYREHYAKVKEKMGHMRAIHGESQNRIHEILRVFDTSDEYGPCVGVSRRDRWDRAHALSLNPPKEVDDILNTKQGSTLPEYSQSVFYGEV